jgi:hypothetical protein
MDADFAAAACRAPRRARRWAACPSPSTRRMPCCRSRSRARSRSETSGRPLNRPARATRTWAWPTNRCPHGCGPRGISSVASSAKCSMMASRSCRLNASTVASRCPGSAPRRPPWSSSWVSQCVGSRPCELYIDRIGCARQAPFAGLWRRAPRGSRGGSVRAGGRQAGWARRAGRTRPRSSRPRTRIRCRRGTSPSARD